MWVILQSNADWDCLKTPILPEILRIQKSTSGGTSCVFWKSFICSNQLDVQETNLSFTQFNRIRNHLFGRWIEIIRALFFKLCDLIVSVFGSVTQTSDRTGRPFDTERSQKSQGKTNVLKTIDCVPSNVQSSRQEALLYVVEDNEAVIKMIIMEGVPQ